MRYTTSILAACATLAIATGAQAAAIIDNGKGIQLGVDSLGQLNVDGGSVSLGERITVVGLRHLTSGGELESTANGCLCEGWGVGADGTSGYANNASGTAGLTSLSFTSGGAAHTDDESVGSTATSVVNMRDLLKVTHEFTPSASDNLYQVHVTIENIGAADVASLRYRRTFDWDVDPTAFSEFVTIGGTAGATAVIGATDDGFCSSNPYSGCGTIVSGSSGDFVDSGPADHGANFDFDFGALAVGATFEFDIFYGAAFTESAAFSALAAVGAEVYSFGQALGDEKGGNGSTFIFAFKGVGGTPVGQVPEPAALALFGLGVIGLGAARRRRKA